MSDINKLTTGLFFHKGRYWYLNFKDIPILFKRIIFTLKHGYSPTAQWETFDWFIVIMREILTNYRNNRCGTSIVIPEFEWDNPDSEQNNIEAYNKILDEMINLLNQMDEHNPIYDDMPLKEADAAQEAAKDKFFKLFSEYFYTLWD